MLPLATALLLLAVEEVHLGLGHGQNAGKLDATEPQLVGDGLQDGPLVRLHLTVGEGGLQLDLEEEAQDVALPQARLAKLRQGLAQGKSASLPRRNDSWARTRCSPARRILSIRLDATRISCSVTWPLALAMWPMTAKVAWKKTACCCWLGARWKAPRIPMPRSKRWPIHRPSRAPKMLPSRKPKKVPSTLPQIRMVQDLVMLMGAGEQLLVQLAQPIHCADVAPLASQQAATHPSQRHPVAQQGASLRARRAKPAKAAG